MKTTLLYFCNVLLRLKTSPRLRKTDFTRVCRRIRTSFQNQTYYIYVVHYDIWTHVFVVDYWNVAQTKRFNRRQSSRYGGTCLNVTSDRTNTWNTLTARCIMVDADVGSACRFENKGLRWVFSQEVFRFPLFFSYIYMKTILIVFSLTYRKNNNLTSYHNS